MRQPTHRRNSKEWHGKEFVDIIPSNFLQTQMLPDHQYPIPQRKTLIRIIRESPQ
jgi:hypothetical protein